RHTRSKRDWSSDMCSSDLTLSAMHVFQKNGMEKTTVSEIVKGAGIAQGTFYLYFPSKLSVMPAIASVLVENTIEQFESNNTAQRSEERRVGKEYRPKWCQE